MSRVPTIARRPLGVLAALALAAATLLAAAAIASPAAHAESHADEVTFTASDDCWVKVSTTNITRSQVTLFCDDGEGGEDEHWFSVDTYSDGGITVNGDTHIDVELSENCQVSSRTTSGMRYQLTLICDAPESG